MQQPGLWAATLTLGFWRCLAMCVEETLVWQEVCQTIDIHRADLCGTIQGAGAA